MTVSKLQVSIAEGFHRQLLDLKGRWSGQMKTWFEPGILAETNDINGEIIALYDGRFIEFVYHSSIQDKNFTGKMTVGMFIPEQKIQMWWIDTFHMGTAMMLSEGKPGTSLLSVLGTYGTGGENPETWGWRTIWETSSSGHLLIRAYNITPSGEEALATEMDLRRLA